MTLLCNMVNSTLPPRTSIRALLQLFHTLNVAHIDSLWHALATYVAPMMVSLSLHEVGTLNFHARSAHC